MSRRIHLGVAATSVLALSWLAAPRAANAAACINVATTDPLYCTPGYVCNIESRVKAGSPLATQNLCSDTCDNDANSLQDALDPHCQSEVLCQDGIDNDGDNLVDGADFDCKCMAQNTGITNCTANDIAISYTSDTSISDGCINSTDSVTISRLVATITSSSPNRYDIGLWLALDGGSAQNSNLCTRDILTPASTSAGTTGPFPSGGFFGELDGDACGDSPSQSVSTYVFPYAVTAPCTDLIVSSAGQNGYVDLGQCGSWDNNSNSSCANPTQAIPGTAAKCRCQRADSAIPGPNFRTACTNFAASGYPGPTFDAGETASYSLDYTNAVANCTPGTPALSDPFGRARCGTASFIRLVVTYPSFANTTGTFLYNNGGTDATIPICTVSQGIIKTSPTADPLGTVCNDTTNNRLIFAPTDPNPNKVYGVVSAFSGTRSLPFKYALTTNVSGLTFEEKIYWDNTLDTSPADNSISTAEAIDLTGAALQTCSDCACSTTAQTTPITLASFRATPSGREVRFDWTTETEAGNIGFNIFAIAGGRKVRLNDEPIPTRGSDSLEPQSYATTLSAPPEARDFLVEDLDVIGGSRFHGPFRLDRQYGSAVGKLPIDWPQIRREHGLAAREDARQLGSKSNSARRSPAVTRASAPTSVTSPALAAATVAAPPVVELFVDRDGLYRVTYEQLLAAGFDYSQQASAQLGLTSRGTPIPIYVSAGTRFGPGSYFEFWGQALDTVYTRTNVYRLLTGQKKPARASVASGAASGAPAASYVEIRRFERDKSFSFTDTATDPFYDTQMLVFSSPGSWDFPFSIDAVAPGAGAAALRAEVYGGTSYQPVSPDHHVAFLINGVPIGDVTFDGPAGATFAGTIPAGVLAEGVNTLTVRLPADLGAPADLVYFDGFTIEYPRAFAAQGDALSFNGKSGRFDIAGLSSAGVVAYRRDGSSLTRLSGLTVVPDSGSYRAVVPGSTTGATYVVAADSGLLAPQRIAAARSGGDLKTGPASYLVISHAAFLDGIGPLVAARAAQGLSVKVVDVEDIYAQFGAGVFDPQAIRAYISWAYGAMATRYVLLVGGDSFDYLDHLGLGAISFVPSLYRDMGPVVHFAPSDASYADVDGDGLQDLAIGRLPARTPQDLDAMIAKTLQYGSSAYGPVGVAAADYTDPSANESFATASDRIIDRFSANWSFGRVYMDQLALNDARERFFAGVADGSALTDYVGHSGLYSWGSPTKSMSLHLFTVKDVASLGNTGKPTVVVQLGCWNTLFSYPKLDTLGLRLVLEPDRGAAAVMGPATLTEDRNGNRFGALLIPTLSEPGMRIGDAIWQAKKSFAAQSPKNADVRDILLGWTLLGDPALQVKP